MSSANLMFQLLSLWWLFLSHICCADSQEGVYGGGISSPNPCLNCSICQFPCQPQPQPPPPPQSQPQPPPPSGYETYGAPPPPPAAGVGNCSPVPVQCCQFPPPVPYSSLPLDNDSASPIKPLGTTVWCSVIFFLLLFVFVFHV